ncbi:MAG: CapA family protein [Gemmatimonadetes bacterium]|nr:CapA family protein [Gemmatimonadota bacterium]
MSEHGETTLFLSGDVMTGRGIDQVLPHPCPPDLYEGLVTSAEEYVALAEAASGPISRPVEPGYVWGDALAVLERVRPAARIINLETSITTSEAAVPKGINYRMHPANVAVLTVAGTDCCVLANNHVLDWSARGLIETLEVLGRVGIRVAGAGRDAAAARAPAVLPLERGGSALVFGFGTVDSGIPRGWAAAEGKPGVNLLADLSDETVAEIAGLVAGWKRPGDVVVASIHWGGNWGYEIPAAHRRFAHALIDRAGVDVVHGHSSHHPKAIEVYRGRPILYGCGDLVDDYEGIRGYEELRHDLVLMYFPTVDAGSGRLVRLEMTPLRIRRFQLVRPSAAEREWLRARLDRECGQFGGRVVGRGDGLALEWR